MSYSNLKLSNDTKVSAYKTFSDDQKRIAMIDNDGTTETIRYQYDNHLGSASLELDQNAATISYEEYHPFGTTSYRSGRTETEVSLKRYKYVGKERDEETGLYYYGARYYAAWIARFVSVDPLAEKYQNLSPYNYVANSPIKSIDPDGRKIEIPFQEDEVSEDPEGDLKRHKKFKRKLISRLVLLAVIDRKARKKIITLAFSKKHTHTFKRTNNGNRVYPDPNIKEVFGPEPRTEISKLNPETLQFEFKPNPAHKEYMDKTREYNKKVISDGTGADTDIYINLSKEYKKEMKSKSIGGNLITALANEIFHAFRVETGTVNLADNKDGKSIEEISSDKFENRIRRKLFLKERDENRRNQLK